MERKELLEVIYDTLAQNSVEPADAAYVTEAIDHIDYDSQEIEFINPKNGKQYALTIVDRR